MATTTSEIRAVRSARVLPYVICAGPSATEFRMFDGRKLAGRVFISPPRTEKIAGRKISVKGGVRVEIITKKYPKGFIVPMFGGRAPSAAFAIDCYKAAAKHCRRYV
jgi:hypothetical protein